MQSKKMKKKAALKKKQSMEKRNIIITFSLCALFVAFSVVFVATDVFRPTTVVANDSANVVNSPSMEDCEMYGTSDCALFGGDGSSSADGANGATLGSCGMTDAEMLATGCCINPDVAM